jgi:Leu/Phe-tRNA-protein transferase
MPEMYTPERPQMGIAFSQEIFSGVTTVTIYKVCYRRSMYEDENEASKYAIVFDR